MKHFRAALYLYAGCVFLFTGIVFAIIEERHDAWIPAVMICGVCPIGIAVSIVSFTEEMNK